MSKIKTLHDLLIEEIKDLYSAEVQLVKALPKLAEAASDESLKNAFLNHLRETEAHVVRLDRIGDLLTFSPKGVKCPAMEGLVAEGKRTISEDAEPNVKDAALIVAAQKVEHYEIAGYGAVRTFAEILDYEEVRDLLRATLDEEKGADDLLTEIASAINLAAEASSKGNN